MPRFWKPNPDEPVTAHFIGEPDRLFYYEHKPPNEAEQAGQVYHRIFNSEMLFGRPRIIDLEEGSDGVWRRKK